MYLVCRIVSSVGYGFRTSHSRALSGFHWGFMAWERFEASRLAGASLFLKEGKSGLCIKKNMGPNETQRPLIKTLNP